MPSSGAAHLCPGGIPEHPKEGRRYFNIPPLRPSGVSLLRFRARPLLLLGRSEEGIVPRKNQRSQPSSPG